jgi:hypothetical protein
MKTSSVLFWDIVSFSYYPIFIFFKMLYFLFFCLILTTMLWNIMAQLWTVTFWSHQTYKTLIMHWHVLTNSLPHLFFLIPKIKYLMRKDQIWYMKTLVNMNMLLSKWLTNDLPSLESKWMTNKTRKGITISQMVDVLVSIEYGMKVFGHHDHKSYVK